jgi:hypothetical protein
LTEGTLCSAKSLERAGAGIFFMVIRVKITIQGHGIAHRGRNAPSNDIARAAQGIIG